MKMVPELLVGDIIEVGRFVNHREIKGKWFFKIIRIDTKVIEEEHELSNSGYSVDVATECQLITYDVYSVLLDGKPHNEPYCKQISTDYFATKRFIGFKNLTLEERLKCEYVLNLPE